MAEKLRNADGTFDGCFGCGVGNPVGLKLAFERDGDTIRSRTILDRNYAGYRDFAHGGVVAAILDEAMGWALLHIGGNHGVTRRLEVNYRRPVRVGHPLLVTADLKRDEQARASARSVIAVVRARVEDERGRVLAEAHGEWVLVREQRSV